MLVILLRKEKKNNADFLSCSLRQSHLEGILMWYRVDKKLPPFKKILLAYFPNNKPECHFRLLVRDSDCWRFSTLGEAIVVLNISEREILKQNMYWQEIEIPPPPGMLEGKDEDTRFEMMDLE